MLRWTKGRSTLLCNISLRRWAYQIQAILQRGESRSKSLYQESWSDNLPTFGHRYVLTPSLSWLKRGILTILILTPSHLSYFDKICNEYIFCVYYISKPVRVPLTSSWTNTISVVKALAMTSMENKNTTKNTCKLHSTTI